MDSERRDLLSSDPPLGVVIPTLNEARRLPSLLDDLEELSLPHRVVVVDGGSADGTPNLARSRGTEVRSAPRGRASQLNAGAAALDAPWLLFLHADVRLDRTALDALQEWLSGAEPDQAAYFQLRFAGDHWFYRVAEKVQRLRERISGLVYGDQGLLIHRRLFDAVGGYPELPLMEDVEIVRRIRSRARTVRLPADVVTSPRRYEREGRWLGWLRNGLMMSLYLMGAPPRALARWYRPEPHHPSGGGPPDPGAPHDPGAPPDLGGSPSAAAPASRATLREQEGDARVLLVFAKAPVEGRVKTRLARAVGAERATELYRAVGRRVVDQVRGGRYRTIVCYDPPEAENLVRSWLGEDELEFRPQRGEGLGDRMAESFQRAFDEARKVCIVGTDAPGVDRQVVDRALDALNEADVVLGPATDGGYYLMALLEPRPALFQNIPWSTSSVLEVTLKRADGLGLRVRLLDERTDLDTIEDLGQLGLTGA